VKNSLGSAEAVFCLENPMGIRRVFQKHKLLHVFGNPGFGGEILPVPKARSKILGEKESRWGVLCGIDSSDKIKL